MAIEREVAGLRCGEVLADLSEYLDGDLPSERRAQLEAHLRGCDVCERFGGSFSSAIQALRRGERSDPAESSAIFERLRQRLESDKA
jgi:anti-sigma factor RsiW